MYKRSPRIMLALLFLAVARLAYADTSLPELVRRVKPSVVAIATYDEKGQPLATGSGFFIKHDQVLTNLHVMRNAYRAEIKTLDAKGRVFPVAGVLSIDEDGDLVVLNVSVPADRSRPLELATALPEEGEKIFVVGNPLKLEGSISDGIVSAVREIPSVGKIIQISAPVSHGNSGSPVFNFKGQVVGVVTIRVVNGENINLAIEAARIARMPARKFIMLAELAAKNPDVDKGESAAQASYRNGLDSMWLGNYEGALAYFETAANKNPQKADAWIQVGYCKAKQGKIEDAVRAYQQALQLRPESAEVYNHLGDAYFYAGDFNEAVAAYKEAVRLSPKSPDGYYNLALTYHEMGENKLAEAQSKLVLALDDKLYEKLLSEMRH